MITENQRKQVEFNDRAVKNYKRNLAIKISKEEKDWKETLERRKQTPNTKIEHKIIPCYYYINWDRQTIEEVEQMRGEAEYDRIRA